MPNIPISVNVTSVLKAPSQEKKEKNKKINVL